MASCRHDAPASCILQARGRAASRTPIQASCTRAGNDALSQPLAAKGIVLAGLPRREPCFRSTSIAAAGCGGEEGRPMIAHTTQSQSRSRAVWDPLQRLSAGSATGGLAAGLFGTMFAGLGLLAGWDLAGIPPVAGYLALCGVASGALVGIVCATVEVSKRSSEDAVHEPDPIVFLNRWDLLGASVAVHWEDVGRPTDPDQADCPMPSCRDARSSNRCATSK